MPANSAVQRQEKLPAGKQRTSRKQYKESNKKHHDDSVPIWLRFVLLGSICLVAVLSGAIIGYGLIGNGSPLDALRFDTWKHIVDLVVQKN